MPALSKLELCALLPHGETMCLLHAVESWDSSGIVCVAVSHCDHDNPLRRTDRLNSICGLEYAAQAMAVHVGLTSPLQDVASIRVDRTAAGGIRTHGRSAAVATVGGDPGRRPGAKRDDAVPEESIDRTPCIASCRSFPVSNTPDAPHWPIHATSSRHRSTILGDDIPHPQQKRQTHPA